MDSVRQAIETFVSGSLAPAVLEPGEPLIPIVKDHYALEQRGQRLTHPGLGRPAQPGPAHPAHRATEAWADDSGGREVRPTRRIDRPDRPRAPATQEFQRKSSRMVFRERLRLFLSREFPDWKIAEVTSEANLEHSLSPAFPRAFLRRGTSGWAAIGAGPEVSDVAGCLAVGLIWLDYLRQREPKITIEGLAIVVPAGKERAVSLRLPFLNHDAANSSSSVTARRISRRASIRPIMATCRRFWTRASGRPR